MNPEELEAIVLAGLINGGATPDAFDVIATTPEEAFSIVFRKRKLTAVCSHQTRIGNLDAHLI
ncbi:hypothetical protein [Escherichia coli]|uniref:hypothetical protein n=1 Tax=Escherichia coli TaxID=562 RepID=UPI0005493C52|nr:hypothetical protein [Escherichia coli]AIZ83043.1 hypothetical protein HW42_14385 [Escherichia coli]TJL69162.1 hypothetical protein C9065_20125 [Escherichia coli]